MNARKGWQTLEGKFHSKIAVIRSFLKEIERIEGIFIVEAINLSNFYAFSTTDESPHQYTSRALLERINDFALSSNGNAEVYSDKISKEERARIRYPYKALKALINESLRQTTTSMKFVVFE